MVDKLVKFRNVIQTAGWTSAASFNGMIFGGSSDKKFQVWDLSKAQEIHGASFASSLFTDNPNGSCVIAGGASAFFSSSSAASLQTIELSSSFTTRQTPSVSGASWPQVGGTRGRTMAYNPRNGKIATSSTTAGAVLAFFDPATGTFGSGNAFVSGDTYTTVIAHPLNGNFLAGFSNNGSTVNPGIREFSAAVVGSSPNQTLTLVQSASFNLIGNRGLGSGNGGTAVAALTAYPDASKMVVCDSFGILSLITYPGGQVLDRLFINSGGFGGQAGGCILSEIVNGFFLAGYNSTVNGTNGPPYFCLIQATQTELRLIHHELLTSTDAIFDLGFDTTSGTIWVMQNDSWMKIYDWIPPTATTVPTRVQDPPGLDVGARILRIRDYGKQSILELDTTIGAGVSSIAATAGGEYYEIALTGTGITRKWDWRKFVN